MEKYLEKDQIVLSKLVEDIIKALPVSHFKDSVEYEDVVQKLLKQLWPSCKDEISSQKYKALLNYVYAGIKKLTQITFTR